MSLTSASSVVWVQPRARSSIVAVVAAVLSCSTAVRAQASGEAAQDAFERGTELFAAAKNHQETQPADGDGARRRYQEAATAFADAWRAGVASTEVFTNAANSYAFAGDVAGAILFYRRALAVDPGNQRAVDGLAHLRAQLPIRRPRSASSSLAETLFFWHDGTAFKTRLTLFAVLFPLAFLFLTIALWKSKPFVVLGIVCLLPGIALAISLLVSGSAGAVGREAVVTVAVQGRRGNGAAYGESHSEPFPPGTEVTILSTAGDGSDDGWLEVRLLDGSSSWLPSAAVERVVVSG